MSRSSSCTVTTRKPWIAGILRSCTIRAASVTLGLAACADHPIAPPDAGPELAATKFWEAGSSVGWNIFARELLASRSFLSFAQTRVLAYLSVAQYNAVITAENAKEGSGHPSLAAAAAGASVVVLKGFFPADATAIDAHLAAQRAEPGWPGEQHRNAERGEEIGRAVGTAIAAYAATDGLNSFVPTPKTGSIYYWTSSLVPPAPAGLGFYGMRPFALRSGDQFRSAPPPPLESTEFQEALSELRAISDTRTAEQIAIAQKWATRGGSYWNSVVTEMIVRYRRSEREAAHTLALANMAGFDGIIACFDAKFFYWLARPTTVDTRITLAVPLPNFPAYPSAHSCSSGGYATVLSHVFPAETRGLEAQMDEIGLARMYGGLHYRFDVDAGRVLARQVAAWVISQDVGRHELIALD